MQPYLHRVQYYEIDKMGITHHSNYIRWMEEARVDFLDQIGWSFAKLESLGVASPVLAVRCSYQHPTRFSDWVKITVTLKSYHGVRMTIGYRMEGPDGALVCEGETDHCFVNAAGQPLRLRRELPAFDAALTALLGAN